MTSISELFPKCRKLAYDARQQLSFVQQQEEQKPLHHHQQQQSSNNNVNSSGGGLSELFIILENLDIQLKCMNDLVLRETPEQRAVWQRKIYELRQDYTTVHNQGRTIEQRLVQNQRSKAVAASSYQSDRDELMALRRRKNKGQLNSSNGQHNDVNNLTDESTSLEQSQYMVMNVIDQGQASLAELISQRQRLTGISGVALDISNRLGLTQATMKIIERRDATDAYFVAGGAVITLIVLYFTWFY
jgi:golgi SNAP receptor complex member 2